MTHFSIVSRQLPEREGTAPGRALWATVEGLREAGHTVDVWSWGPEAPSGDLPADCVWKPLPPEPLARTKARALVRPRTDPVIAGWRPRPGAVALGDDPFSFAATASQPRSVLTQHYLTRLDLWALRRLEPRDLQDLRAERRNARQARAIIAYSQRVARELSPRAVAVPIPCPVPPEPLPVVDEPVAVMFADWRWPPNQRALARLAEVWPAVVERVPHARLVLVGRGTPRPPRTIPRCEVRGEVPTSRDALEGMAVLAFPCPPTSGPKVKVLEALAYGVPVLTTPAGAEGVAEDLPARTPGAGLVVATGAAFAERLAALLGDPEVRAQAARQGREAVLAAHSPLPAARAKAAAVARLLDLAEDR